MLVLADPISLSLDTILLATDFCAESERAAAYAKALARRFGSTLEIAHVFDPSLVTSYEEAIVGLPVGREAQDLRRGPAGAQPAPRLPRSGHAHGVGRGASARSGAAPDRQGASRGSAGRGNAVEVRPGAPACWARPPNSCSATRSVRCSRSAPRRVSPKTRPSSSAPSSTRRTSRPRRQRPPSMRSPLPKTARPGSTPATCVPAIRRARRSTELRDSAFLKALQRMIPEGSYDWCSPECVVEHGDAATAILHLAERVHADLIVLGARRASFWLTHVERGLSSRLLAEAACPVMTVS